MTPDEQHSQYSTVIASAFALPCVLAAGSCQGHRGKGRDAQERDGRWEGVCLSGAGALVCPGSAALVPCLAALNSACRPPCRPPPGPEPGQRRAAQDQEAWRKRLRHRALRDLRHSSASAKPLTGLFHHLQPTTHSLLALDDTSSPFVSSASIGPGQHISRPHSAPSTNATDTTPTCPPASHLFLLVNLQ